MLLTDLMKHLIPEPRSIAQFLSAQPEVSTTEMLASLFEAATLKLVTISASPSRNPLEARVALYGAGMEEVQPTPAEAQIDHNAKEAEADIVERYHALEERFASARRHGSHACKELKLVSETLKDTHPNLATAITSALGLIPHE